MAKKTSKIYLAINRNGFVGMYNEEPKRNETTGKWESKYPYVNSVLYEQMCELAKQAQLTWESSPEYFEIQYENV